MNGIIGGLILLLSILSYTDIRHRMLSNKLIVLVSLAVLPLSWLLYQQIFIFSALICLVIGFILFLFNIIGAGDVKLLSALMLMVPADNAFPLLLLISLWGLVVIVVGLIFSRQSMKQRGVPYGVAIGLGFLTYLYFIL